MYFPETENSKYDDKFDMRNIGNLSRNCPEIASLNETLASTRVDQPGPPAAPRGPRPPGQSVAKNREESWTL